MVQFTELHPQFCRALALFFGVFALYALTAQRGLGWGDSGEFQYRILTLGWDGIFKGCDSFATAHPLYVALAKLVASTPFQVTLLSAFFGALAVTLFYLLSRNLALAALFALAHGLWWLSTVSEVYTMSLAFFAAELLALRRFRETGSIGALLSLAALNGLHLEVHNFALLALPVYVWVVLSRTGGWCAHIPCAPDAHDGKKILRTLLLAAPVWFLTASLWIWSFFALGPANVLFGSYGAQVLAQRPVLPAAIPLNLALGAMTLAVPILLVVWKVVRRETGDMNGDARHETKTKSSAVHLHLFSPPCLLFAIHFLFWVRYFVIDQFTFVLPSVLLAYLIAADVLASSVHFTEMHPRGSAPSRKMSGWRFHRLIWVLLFALQLLLPVAAWGVLSAVCFPAAYCAEHPGRNNAAYFALPWHVTDDSAARAAALQRTPWKGYP